MTQVIFRREARRDVLQAYRWYEDQESGLGAAFRAELDATVGRIRQNPRAYRILYKETRRARLRRFPYSLFFREYDETIVVVAVFHASRDPSSWKRRAE